jgi:undecaprenyl phosphate-alpha-L-ara4FN deformylase
MPRTLIGLRVDVDTYRGTRDGVPELVRTLGKHGVRATFFFSVGPDNMGRHVLRLLRPTFLVKMLRTRAAGLYGWDILLRGTFWPGPQIGRRLGPVIRACADAGHEIGLHGWDHHGWQTRVSGMTAEDVRVLTARGLDVLDALSAPACCSAAPAWRCTPAVLEAKAGFPRLRFNSDCRGEGVFRPRVGSVTLDPPQVPVNLPTYDEAVGRSGVRPDDWNDLLLSLIRPEGYNVLTVHAEVEGGRASRQFDEFVSGCAARGWTLAPLSTLLPQDPSTIPEAAVIDGAVEGRDGWISMRARVSP